MFSFSNDTIAIFSEFDWQTMMIMRMAGVTRCLALSVMSSIQKEVDQNIEQSCQGDQRLAEKFMECSKNAEKKWIMETSCGSKCYLESCALKLIDSSETFEFFRNKTPKARISTMFKSENYTFFCLLLLIDFECASGFDGGPCSQILYQMQSGPVKRFCAKELSLHIDSFPNLKRAATQVDVKYDGKPIIENAEEQVLSSAAGFVANGDHLTDSGRVAFEKQASAAVTKASLDMATPFAFLLCYEIAN